MILSGHPKKRWITKILIALRSQGIEEETINPKKQSDQDFTESGPSHRKGAEILCGVAGLFGGPVFFYSAVSNSLEQCRKRVRTKILRWQV
jgi:hypothetical protein